MGREVVEGFGERDVGGEEGIEEFEEENVRGPKKGNIEALKKVWVLKNLEKGNVGGLKKRILKGLGRETLED